MFGKSMQAYLFEVKATDGAGVAMKFYAVTLAPGYREAETSIKSRLANNGFTDVNLVSMAETYPGQEVAFTTL